MGMTIEPADMSDLQDILQLQYLAYTSEADLFEDRNIPPLTQTLDEVISEYNEGMILKAVDTDGMKINLSLVRQLTTSIWITCPITARESDTTKEMQNSTFAITTIS